MGAYTRACKGMRKVDIGLHRVSIRVVRKLPTAEEGVYDIRGYLIGVLVTRGSYDLGVYLRGPQFC